MITPMSTLPEAPLSPCVGICRLDDRTCAGCGRLIEEIIEWPAATAARKSLIALKAAERLAIIQARSISQDTRT